MVVKLVSPFGFALAWMAEDKTKACRDSMQVHEATSLGCVREQMVVKLVDIPTNMHDQCRQVNPTPLLPLGPFDQSS